MHIVLAPNSFKNNLPADEVAKALKEGLLASGLYCTLKTCPVGDGGDGTGALLRKYFNTENITRQVFDPLGRLVNAVAGITTDKQTAIIELADASGLRLLKPEEYNPLLANTTGTGMLMKAALDKKVSTIVLCIGGSATVDGGSGILRELGVVFRDDNDLEITDLPKDLIRLKTIDLSGLDQRIFHTGIIILCDVKNKLLGDKGAARNFAPQKGASEEEVLYLENCLIKMKEAVAKATGKDMNDITHGGASGGVAAGLWAVCGAKPVNGIDYFLQQIRFEKVIRQADLIITGEGALDAQTLDGKAPLGVALAAIKNNIPVYAVAGKIEESARKQLSKYFDRLICINDSKASQKEALKNTKINLKSSAEKIGRSLLHGFIND